MRRLIVLLALAVAAGCTPSGDPAVVWKGQTPTNSRVGDSRAIEFRCPACGGPIAPDDAKCRDKKCGAVIRWGDRDYRCGYCGGSGECGACRLMNTKGECYNCLGKGQLSILGRAPECPNCAKVTKGKCAACRGKMRDDGKSPACDFCGGAGEIPLGTLKTKVKAPAEKESSDE